MWHAYAPFMKPYETLVIVVVAVLATAGCVHIIENPGTSDEPERIGIIGAMDAEVSALKSAMHIDRKETVESMEFCVGKLRGCDVVVVQCGMGKVNAGTCAQLLVTKFNARAIINTGVAGSLDDCLNIGDFVVSTDAVQHDFDVSPIGFQKGEIPYTEKYAFEADATLRQKAFDAISKNTTGVKVYEGRICSGDQFVSTVEQKETITAAFGGMCCEMEGAAIAQVCYLNNVPFVVIRTVSDKADGTAPSDFDEFTKEAAARSSAVVLYFLENESP